VRKNDREETTLVLHGLRDVYVSLKRQDGNQSHNGTGCNLPSSTGFGAKMPAPKSLLSTLHKIYSTTSTQSYERKALVRTSSNPEAPPTILDYLATEKTCKKINNEQRIQ